MPHLMNRPHSEDWCLTCVKEMHGELEAAEAKAAALDKILAAWSAVKIDEHVFSHRTMARTILGKMLSHYMFFAADPYRTDYEDAEITAIRTILEIVEHLPECTPVARLPLPSPD